VRDCVSYIVSEYSRVGRGSFEMEPECDLPYNCNHEFVVSMESPLGVSSPFSEVVK
jgi:hypothetical protein